MTTTIRSVTINPADTITTAQLDGGNIGANMCALIGCRTFDVVGLADDIDLFVDDKGLINGSPLNLPATVLTHLLGFKGVRNYDGSWTEWGSAVRVPIVRGSEPGPVPIR